MVNLSLAVYEAITPRKQLTKSDDTIVCNPVKQTTMGVHKKYIKLKAKIHQSEFVKKYLFDKVVNIVYFM